MVPAAQLLCDALRSGVACPSALHAVPGGYRYYEGLALAVSRQASAADATLVRDRPSVQLLVVLARPPARPTRAVSLLCRAPAMASYTQLNPARLRSYILRLPLATRLLLLAIVGLWIAAIPLPWLREFARLEPAKMDLTQSA